MKASWYRNNKLNENLVAWDEEPEAELAGSGHHQPAAAAGTGRAQISSRLRIGGGSVDAK